MAVLPEIYYGFDSCSRMYSLGCGVLWAENRVVQAVMERNSARFTDEKALKPSNHVREQLLL